VLEVGAGVVFGGGGGEVAGGLPELFFGVGEECLGVEAGGVGVDLGGGLDLVVVTSVEVGAALAVATQLHSEAAALCTEAITLMGHAPITQPAALCWIWALLLQPQA
jgi:hypothetical protein